MNQVYRRIFRFWPIILLLLLSVTAVLLTAISRSRPAAPPSPSVADCRLPLETATPLTSWRFQTDPDDVGLDAGWHNPDFDYSAWAESTPGRPWEELGYVDYDGVAWYRASFDLPVSWPTAYLSTLGVDDRATLWINGEETAVAQVLPLTPGQTIHLTYRIVDEGGFGGIKKAANVGASLQAVLPADDYGRYLADEYPAWPQPGWVEQRYHAWTFTSPPQTVEEALITADVDVAPWADAPLVSLWVRDEEGTLHAPAQAVFSLAEDTLPIPQASWQAAGLDFAATLAARPDGAGAYWQTVVTNPTAQRQRVTLLLAVRPLAVEADLRPIYTSQFVDETLWLNDQPFLATQPAATAVQQGDLAVLGDSLTAGLAASAADNCTPDGTRAVLMSYELTLAPGAQEAVVVAFPAQPGDPVPPLAEATAQIDASRQQWQSRLSDSILSVPDALVMNAYRASRGYLHIALDPNGPHPGPLEHDALWVRDAAYIGATLLTLGESDIVADYVPSLFAYQREDGFVPAIIEPGSGPRPDEEWDSQGQLIYLIGEYYRYTGDEAQAREWYPAVLSAAEFIRELRSRTADDPPVSRGILPPSKSAEDLGPPEWHHYWDSFWGIAGLEYGAHLATALGFADDAAWMQAEAEALRDALRESITAVMGPEPAYIPNGPEDTVSSAMARGSTNSLYPVEIFSRNDPLIVRSFDEYYDRWLAPQNGGYIHIFGQLWPYGGLGLARNYVRLGRQDVLHQILGWTLTNQTLPGTFAWAEQVNPTTGAISGGDMPHAWAASSYITLIREMLLIDEPARLELFAGVPGSWLEAEETVRLTAAPSPFGPVTAVLEGNLSQFDPAWQGQVTVTVSGANPPDGYRWRLPQQPSRVETTDAITLVDGWLNFPPEGGTAVLHFEP